MFGSSPRSSRTTTRTATIGHLGQPCPRIVSHGLHQRHTWLKRVIYRFAREAGCNVDMEPDAYRLLQGRYTCEDCRMLFPKANATAPQVEALTKLRSQPDDAIASRDESRILDARGACASTRDQMHRHYVLTLGLLIAYGTLKTGWM